MPLFCEGCENLLKDGRADEVKADCKDCEKLCKRKETDGTRRDTKNPPV